MSQYCIVTNAVSSQEEAEKIASVLVSQELAACVQMMPIQSCYLWKGKMINEAEVLLLIKTRGDLYQEVEAAILKNHSYEIPEIIQIPIEKGLDRYLNWMDVSTK